MPKSAVWTAIWMAGTLFSAQAYGQAALSADQFEILFGQRGTQWTGDAQILTLTNTGQVAISGLRFGFTGPNVVEFGIQNECGTSIAAGASCTIQAGFDPAGYGTRSALLSIVSDNAATLNIPFEGIGVDPFSLLSVFPRSVDFGSGVVGVTAAKLELITLKNPAYQPLTLLFGQLLGPNAGDYSYYWSDMTCSAGQVLQGGQSCQVALIFTPSALGERTATFAIRTNLGTMNVPITGTGVTQSLSLSAPSIDFGTQALAVSSPAQSVKLSASAGQSVAIDAVAITGANAADFSLSKQSFSDPGIQPDCTAPVVSLIAGSGNCSIPVVFTPHGPGIRSAMLTISDSSAGSPHSVLLSGTGVNTTDSFIFGKFEEVQTVYSGEFPNLTITVYDGTLTPLDFGEVALGSSNAVSASVTNTGLGTLDLLEQITGDDADEFKLNPANSSNDCTTVTTVTMTQGNCTATIGFTPAASGVRTATLSITDLNSGLVQQAPLSGIGFSPTTMALLPRSYSFGGVTIGRQSQYTEVTLMAVGTQPLTVSGASISGSNASDFQIASAECPTTPTTLSPCSYYLTFTPTGQGYRTAELDVVDNAQNGGQTVYLSGIGLPQNLVFPASPVSVDFGFGSIGVPTQGQVVFYNGPESVTVTGITITGPNASDFEVYQNTCGTVAISGSNCSVSIQFTPSASGPEYASLALASESSFGPIIVPLQGGGYAGSNALFLTTSAVDLSTANGSVVIANPTSVAATVLNATVTGPNAADFTVDCCWFFLNKSTTISPGTTLAVEIRLTQASSDPETATLVIETSAGTLTAPLLANVPVFSGSLRAVPVMLSTTVGSTVEYNETIYQVGTTNVGVTPDNPAFVGLNAADFSLGTGVTCDNSEATLESPTCRIPILFIPGAKGPRAASLSLNGGNVLIPISGIGN